MYKANIVKENFLNVNIQKLYFEVVDHTFWIWRLRYNADAKTQCPC